MPVIEQQKALKPFNTFGVPATARKFTEIFHEDDLSQLYVQGAFQEPYLVLGGGSNILFTHDFDGLVIKVSVPGIEARREKEVVYVTAGAGVVWNDLVQFCVKSGFAGIENLSLIPGTVGASPVQNIGAYGVELKDVFESCTAFEIASSAVVRFNKAECRFGYRESIFKNELKGRYIITSVTFRLSTVPSLNTRYGAIEEELKKRQIAVPGIADISRIVSEIRVSKLPDPSTIGNAGSFFKNPVVEKSEADEVLARFPEAVCYPAPGDKVKFAAGWLIEQCGFKGLKCGQTGTWKHQALVLVNYGHATGQEVYSFSEQIIESVYAKFHIRLEREVNIL
ncbi:UDP-N-acetylmuramate dehydrogenase [Pedobacter sp. JY14-1]|uniref:UDP-N-acetylmuramate dehydrogenase n=1 Tax=Pedobacter sp. JY14-1 TaxID=3034151 RepID=UPI0023E1B3F1|nr:UDP-N-acetylmuramate dehydrogenase [Pedobacter sp. JY14-1]